VKRQNNDNDEGANGDGKGKSDGEYYDGSNSQDKLTEKKELQPVQSKCH